MTGVLALFGIGMTSSILSNKRLLTLWLNPKSIANYELYSGNLIRQNFFSKSFDQSANNNVTKM